MNKPTIHIISERHQQAIDAAIANENPTILDTVSHAICSLLATFCLAGFIAPWLI